MLLIIGHASAQECEDLLKLALSQDEAGRKLILESDDLKDIAIARVKSGANFQRPVQQSFTKQLQAQSKMTEAVASLNKAVAKNCGPEYVEMRDNAQDNLDNIKHHITTMRKLAPEGLSLYVRRPN